MKRFLFALSALLAALLALAGPAAAHVTVNSDDATPGGYGQLNFVVPCESDTASTTKIAVQLPTFAEVLVQPKSGWTSATTTTKLAKPITNDDGDKISSAITAVTWTASGKGIQPGHFDTFVLSVGPFPKSKSVSFGAVQTYSDGKVVRWNQQAAPGSNAEPDFPRPTLQLTSTAAAAPTLKAASSSSSDSSTTLPTTLSIVALVLGAVALALAVRGARRSS